MSRKTIRLAMLLEKKANAQAQNNIINLDVMVKYAILSAKLEVFNFKN